MKNITKIIYKENIGLFEITIDERKYLISYEFYDNYNIKLGEIDEEAFLLIEGESEYQDSKKAAVKFANYKFRTEFEVIQKIRTKTKNPEIIRKIIDYLKKIDLINDERYIKEYIEYSLEIKNFSKNETISKMLAKGLKKEEFSSHLSVFNSENEFENLNKLFNKKYKNLDLSDRKNKEKVIRYFISKGYSYSLISKLIGELK